MRCGAFGVCGLVMGPGSWTAVVSAAILGRDCTAAVHQSAARTAMLELKPPVSVLRKAQGALATLHEIPTLVRCYLKHFQAMVLLLDRSCQTFAAVPPAAFRQGPGHGIRLPYHDPEPDTRGCVEVPHPILWRPPVACHWDVAGKQCSSNLFSGQPCPRPARLQEVKTKKTKEKNTEGGRAVGGGGAALVDDVGGGPCALCGSHPALGLPSSSCGQLRGSFPQAGQHLVLRPPQHLHRILHRHACVGSLVGIL